MKAAGGAVLFALNLKDFSLCIKSMDAFQSQVHV